jgi:signal transduction histidine kinase
MRLPDPKAWLGRRTTTQLAGAIAVLAAIALTGSVLVTGLAVRMDQREKAALVALADYGAMVSKLGVESTLTADRLTEGDAAYLSAWLSAFQSGPVRDARTLEETCVTGRGGAGVRFIRAPVGKPAGLAALGEARAVRAPRLGEDIYVLHLPRGAMCPTRGMEVVAVKRSIGALEIVVGRVVDRSGEAWGWAVLAVAAAAALLMITGQTAAALARHRLTQALSRLSHSLDRAAIGDFSVRAADVAAAPELTELTGQVNLTLDRLEELLAWLRDSADQLAHDFRTPLARAATRLERLQKMTSAPEAKSLIAETRADLRALTRAMNEAMALRDGEAWMYESVRLDQLVAAAADLYQPLADERGVVVRVEAGPVSALGVKSLLQRAVANLVDNAVKFSPEGGVVVLTARAGGDHALLSVADQGSGLDPAVLDDPAAGMADASAQGRESHGMGLRFVRAILKRHGARMTIDDAAPGTVVTAHFSR